MKNRNYDIPESIQLWHFCLCSFITKINRKINKVIYFQEMFSFLQNFSQFSDLQVQFCPTFLHYFTTPTTLTPFSSNVPSTNLTHFLCFCPIIQLSTLATLPPFQWLPFDWWSPQNSQESKISFFICKKQNWNSNYCL